MRMIYQIIFYCIALLATVSAQSFKDMVQVNPASISGVQRAPRIAFAPDGTMYVGWTSRSSHGTDLVVCSSEDGGTTFSEEGMVRKGGDINSNFQRGPRLAIDNHGVVHVVWMEPSDNGPDIFYARSFDGGKNFEDPRSLTLDGGSSHQDFCSVAVDHLGGVYVCFLDNRDVQSGASSNVHIYMTRSVNGGDTFTPSVRVNNMPNTLGGACECCATAMASTTEGHVYIAFRTNINNRRDIFITRSFDRGKTFETAIPVASEQWIIDGCPATGPSIALDENENAHMVWRDSRSSGQGRSRIYYTRLPFGSGICQVDRHISATQNWSEYPELAVSKNGTVLCVFEDGRNDAGDVFYTYSQQRVAAFADPVVVDVSSTSGKQQFADCAVSPVTGHRYIVWQSNDADEGDIFLSRDTTTMGGVTAIDDIPVASAIALGTTSPNPVRIGQLACLPIPVTSGSEITVGIYDALGKRRLTVTGTSPALFIQTAGLLPGVYFIRTENLIPLRAVKMLVVN